MSDRICAGGCGATIPAANKSGFAWGHKNGCPPNPPPPGTPDAIRAEPAVTAEVETEIPTVEITLSECQLDRIWQTLSLHAKGTAIATVLVTHD